VAADGGAGNGKDFRLAIANAFSLVESTVLDDAVRCVYAQRRS
jgi:hypothetical protein